MYTPTDVAQCFYRALSEGDGQALFTLLAEDFIGTVSAGMPHSVGGEHHGREAMIIDVWGRIASIYEMHVEPSEYLTVGPADDAVVVLGTYRGIARDGEKAVDAAFAHIISVRDGHITALQQITDTVRWQIPT